ncbi:MAG: chemotaxis protein, partial [Rhizobacter sp.]|nr:chemotaxis protein [Rhizobacter sp.]
MILSTTEISKVALAEGVFAALNNIQALISFDLAGHVTEVNDVFLGVMGYDREEVVGRHHRLFCEPTYARSADYTAFWQILGSGQTHTGEFMRLAKDGRPIWLQASYNPVLDTTGRVVGVVKFATDITAAKAARADVAGRMQALNR